MRPKPAFSARGLALASVFCMLVVAPGCGKETFYLLQGAGTGSAGGALSIVSVAGAAATDISGFGGSAEMAGAASGGAPASAGMSGEPPSEAGTSGAGSCVGGGGCVIDQPACAPSVPFCTACERDVECLEPDARTCDLTLGRCVGCRNDDGCPADKHCDPLTLRCVTPCTGQNDCAADVGHTLCDIGRRACVNCISNMECGMHTHTGPHCYQGACVECFDDAHCGSQVCLAGHCFRPH